MSIRTRTQTETFVHLIVRSWTGRTSEILDRAFSIFRSRAQLFAALLTPPTSVQVIWQVSSRRTLSGDVIANTTSSGQIRPRRAAVEAAMAPEADRESASDGLTTFRRRTGKK